MVDIQLQVNKSCGIGFGACFFILLHFFMLLCDHRRERKLSDYTYKMKRGISGSGATPLVDAYPFDTQTSDTSDYQDGAVHGAVQSSSRPLPPKMDKCHDSAKRKVWRRKRRQSACKEDKSKDVGFSDKVLSSNHLTRRQSLPPLNSISPSLVLPPQNENEAFPTVGLLNLSKEENETPRELSRDSTPRPIHSTTPISPNGTLSPEVTELIGSVQSSFRRSHRRSGSTGSVEKSLRVKSSAKASSLEASPLKTHLHARSPVHRHSLASEKIDASSFSRISPEVSISYLDESSSDNGHSLTPKHNLNSELRSEDAEGKQDGTTRGVAVQVSVPLIYSNDSSMDTHGSDGEGNEADGEGTSDGTTDNVFSQFSGTEPNETASPSSQAESDEPTSHSNPDLSDSMSAHSQSSLPENHNSAFNERRHETTSEDAYHEAISEEHGVASSQQAIYDHDPFPLQYPVVADNILTSTALFSEGWFEDSTSSHTHFIESSPVEEQATDDAKVATGYEALSIPLHIRRDMSPEKMDDGKH